VLERRNLLECTRCHHQASVTAGTVLHGTRTPLKLWFWGAYLVATHTPGISAAQLQRQLGLSRYETAWLMLQKLRRAMVAPEREPLRREVEVDEFFVGGVEEGSHGARQRGQKSLCTGAIEVRGRGSGRLRLQVVPDASARSLGGFVAASVERGAIVRTDAWPGYAGLRGLGFDHRPRSQRALRAAGDDADLVPRLHRAVSNLKSWLRGTHRGVSSDHLQVYLDEFVFRFNRRGSPMAAFQTLLGLGTVHLPTTYEEITRRNQAAA
jgi:transposase-like protein